MPGKILIIDSVPTNRIVLKVKLSSAFYQVSQARCANEAVTTLHKTAPDLIVLSADWEGGNEGLNICKLLKFDRIGAGVPILMLSSNPTPKMRKMALRAGADDLMAKPADEIELFARIRSLMRERDKTEDLRLRTQAAEALGFAETDPAIFQTDARVLFVAPDLVTSVRWSTQMKSFLPFSATCRPASALLRSLAKLRAPDAFVLALDEKSPEESLRLLAELRARSTTRRCAVLVVLPPTSRALFSDALDLGADDIMADGFEAEEVALRLSRLIHAKRQADRYRQKVRDGLEAAVTDPLTGLFNRRYALPHLARVTDLARHSGRDFAVMVADLDHFKSVNDRYGHSAGDAVLTDIATRLRQILRPSDLLARIGGEEFLVVMPSTTRTQAHIMADKLCQTVRQTPVYIKGRDLRIPITISIGLAMASDTSLASDTAGTGLLDQADRALYGAKSTGRDQVTLSTPVA